MEKTLNSRPLSLQQVQVTDTFWKPEMELVRKEVIPYQWEALNDRIPDAAPSFSMRNFRIAGMLNQRKREQGTEYQEKRWPLTDFETLPEDREHLEERFYGCLFQDSDFAKWIEAAGYSLAVHPDAVLERIADEAIEIVCEAQLENGYLDTYYIINDQSRIFTNLRDNHELYCFGHLLEGAIAYYQATGKDKLLKAAERYADFVNSCFGWGENQCKGYPGHEIAEMALIKLYELTGKSQYLDMSRFFVEQRGTRPYYYDQEHPESVKKGHEADLRHMYHQAHLPVREQKEALGHSVRAVYLYSGMADVARVTGDDSLYQACDNLWNNITGEKMYVTGGIGSTHLGEAFSFAYDLPNDTAYAETCASIGLVFFARRMLEIKAVGKYADVMERALYNGVLSGMALDGKSFFYVNPLEVLPRACHQDERKFHVKPVRQKWFGCACCPPNIARLLTSISSYAFTQSADTLYIHLYMGCEINTEYHGRPVTISLTSGFPWDGKVTVQVKTGDSESAEAVPFTIAVRVPDWCPSYKTSMPGEVRDGYLYLNNTWHDGDTVTLDFPMTVRLIQSHPAVWENTGKVALMRGPLVYCLEEADNGPDLHLISLTPHGSIRSVQVREMNQEMIVIHTPGQRHRKDWEAEGLYREYIAEESEAVDLKWIPYYTWGNRGEGEMRVWVPIR